MRKNIFLLCLILFQVKISFAQKGLNPGLVHQQLLPLPGTGIYSDPNMSLFFRSSINNGIALRYGFNDNIELETGAVYSVRRIGGNIRSHNEINRLSGALRSIQVPLLFVIKRELRENLRVSALAGASVNFFDDEIISGQFLDRGVYMGTESVIRNARHNYFLHLGSGLERYIPGLGSFYFGLSYNYHLTNPGSISAEYQINNIGTVREGRFRASAFQAELKYFLPVRFFAGS